MLVLFSNANSESNRGRVQSFILTGEQNIPAMIRIDSFKQSIGAAAIITRFEIHESVLAQVTPMIGNAVYIYVFNNAPADIVVTGVGFQRGCDGDGHGLAKLREFYAGHRATSRSDPLSIVIFPGIVFRGFLLSASYSNDDPATQLVGFRYSFKMVGSND